MLSTFFLYGNAKGLDLLLPKLTFAKGRALPESPSYNRVIQWGTQLSRLENGVLLNPALAVKRCYRIAYMKEVLTLHGFRVDLNDGSSMQTMGIHRLFHIPVFHLEALALFVRTSYAASSFEQEIEVDWQYSLYRRMAREAIRAIYVLGLDYGMVQIRVEDKGRTTVVGVDPEPALTERLSQLYSGAMKRYAEDGEQEDRRMVSPRYGMDPEFVLHHPVRKEIVLASHFLERQGQVGCDAVVRGGQTEYALAELRPTPTSEPRQLIVNLMKTMWMASSLIADRELEWLAGGMPLHGFPLGGHIHLSQIWLQPMLLRSLDNYLALPLVLIEDATTRKRRPRYGFLGDFRRQPHGGFEYRTLPSWIVSPRVTKGVIALTAIIAEHWGELIKQPLQQFNVLAAYYHGNRAELYPVVQALIEDIQRTSTYGLYRHYVDPLLEQILRMEPWKEQRDLRKLWKIPPYSN